MPSYEIEDFRAITQAILDEVDDVIINYSTGAIGISVEKRIEYLRALRPEVAALPQGAIRSDKESVMLGVGRTLEGRLRVEAQLALSMFHRRDSHTLGAGAFKEGNLKPDWPNHGL